MEKLLKEFEATLTAAHFEAQYAAAQKVIAYNNKHMMAACGLSAERLEFLNIAMTTFNPAVTA